MLECVLNLSEGRDLELVALVAAAAGDLVLDVHSDPWHNRSVITLAGGDVLDAAKAVAERAVDALDLARHDGVHPRFGVLDVVPFVPFAPGSLASQPLEAALAARDAFALWAADALGVPSFLYGPERSLPEARAAARRGESPDVDRPGAGPLGPHGHATAGVCCVGARQVLLAWNLLLADASPQRAAELAAGLRSASVRALGFEVAGRGQVSCNLVDPAETGPDQIYDQVSALERVEACELVGLVPSALLERIPERRWAELGLGESVTIESRLAARAAASNRSASRVRVDD